MNAHVDDAIIKATFISSRTERTTNTLAENLVVESGGSLYRMLLSTAIPAGSVIQTVYSEYTTNANLTTVIPLDDTIPQVGEGTQIISLSITPRFAASTILLEFRGAASANPVASIICALFRGSGPNALAATNSDLAAGSVGVVGLVYQDTPATTSAITYTIRSGPGGAQTVRYNGYTTGRVFGGVMRATLVAREIKT